MLKWLVMLLPIQQSLDWAVIIRKNKKEGMINSSLLAQRVS